MAILEQDLTGVIEAHIYGASNYFGVATPGIVVSARNVGDKTVSITVKPAVHKLVESEDDEDVDDVEEFMPLQEVPVCWLVGRGIAVNAKLLPGDSVLLVCLDRDASEWRRTGEASEPTDVRIHDWAHCVAIPGLVPATSPFPAPTDAAALASAVASDLAKIASMLDLAQSGNAFTNTYTAAANTAPIIKARIASKILKLSE